MVIQKYISENKASLVQLNTPTHTVFTPKSGASTQPEHAALKTQLQDCQNVWRNLGRQLWVVLLLLLLLPKH